MILNRLDIPPPLVYNKNKHFSEDMNYVWNPLREKEGMTVTEENIAAEELAEETANELVPADAPPEGAEEENEPQPLPPEEERIPVHPLTKATVIFGYIASWVNLALLLWGCTAAFGKTFSVVTAVEFIINVFNIRKETIYGSIAQLLLAILFIVLLVVFIKNIAQSSAKLARALSKTGDPKLLKKRHIAIATVRGNATYSFTGIFLLIFAAVMLSGGQYLLRTQLLFLYTGVYSLLITFFTAFPRKKGAEYGDKAYGKRPEGARFAVALIRQVLFLALIALFIQHMIVPAVYEFSYNLKLLFNGAVSGAVAICSLLFNGVGQNILFVTATIMLLCSMNTLLDSFYRSEAYMERSSEELQKMFLRILIVTVISAAILCIFSSIGSGGDFTVNETVLRSWWLLLRKHQIPILVGSIAGMLTAKLLR